MFANKLRIEPPPKAGDIEEIRLWLMKFYNRLMKPPATLVIAADTDSLSVANYATCYANTANNNVTIGGLSGGVSGQTFEIYKGSLPNALTIEHSENSGTEKIYTDTAADIVLPENTYGGVTLRCISSDTATYWIVIASSNRS